MSACASLSGGSSGRSAPVLAGSYRISGSFSLSGTPSPDAFVATFLPQQMVQVARELEVGEPEAPFRYSIVGNRVVFPLQTRRSISASIQIWVEYGEEGDLLAHAVGETSETRTQVTCERWGPTDSSGYRRCEKEGSASSQSDRHFRNPLVFDRLSR